MEDSMNESERRRRRLLEQTRNMYSERRMPPAVHPRHGAAYRTLYGSSEEGMPQGTFGIRMFLCFLLFAAFVTMENNQIDYKNVTSDRIVQEITTDLDVEEVWKQL